MLDVLICYNMHFNIQINWIAHEPGTCDILSSVVFSTVNTGMFLQVVFSKHGRAVLACAKLNHAYVYQILIWLIMMTRVSGAFGGHSWPIAARSRLSSLRSWGLSWLAHIKRRPGSMLVTRPTLCYGCFLVGPGHICHDLSPCQIGGCHSVAKASWFDLQNGLEVGCLVV